MKVWHKENLSSEIFLSFIDEFSEAVIVFDPETCEVIYGNNKAYEIFSNGLNLDEVFEKDEYMNFLKLIKDCHSAEHSRIIGFKRFDGSMGLLSFDVFPMLYEESRIVFCRFKDITESIIKKEERRRRNAHLIFKDKMRSFELVTSSITHEINNICNFMLNNLQILNHVWQDIFPILKDYEKEYGEFLAGGLSSSEIEKAMPRLLLAVIDGTNRIRETIDEFKKYVKEGINSQISMVDINEIVRRVVLILSHRIFLYTENFSTNLEKNLPKIKGNFQKLEQVLINLLMNALQSLPDKQRAVKISTGIADSKRIFLEVKDEGVGIPEEVMPHIYEPFFSTKQTEGGTGLGLYLSKAILDEHNAEIVVNSTINKGTTVRVYFPYEL